MSLHSERSAGTHDGHDCCWGVEDHHSRDPSAAGRQPDMGGQGTDLIIHRRAHVGQAGSPSFDRDAGGGSERETYWTNHSSHGKRNDEDGLEGTRYRVRVRRSVLGEADGPERK